MPPCHFQCNWVSGWLCTIQIKKWLCSNLFFHNYLDYTTISKYWVVLLRHASDDFRTFYILAALSPSQSSLLLLSLPLDLPWFSTTQVPSYWLMTFKTAAIKATEWASRFLPYPDYTIQNSCIPSPAVFLCIQASPSIIPCTYASPTNLYLSPSPSLKGLSTMGMVHPARRTIISPVWDW